MEKEQRPRIQETSSSQTTDTSSPNVCFFISPGVVGSVPSKFISGLTFFDSNSIVLGRVLTMTGHILAHPSAPSTHILYQWPHPSQKGLKGPVPLLVLVFAPEGPLGTCEDQWLSIWASEVDKPGSNSSSILPNWVSLGKSFPFESQRFLCEMGEKIMPIFCY